MQQAMSNSVTLAKAGAQLSLETDYASLSWIPAFAGMTKAENGA